jgi:hypothetical protein
MLCVVALNVDVLQAAVRVLPTPVSTTAPQVAMVIPPSVKFTVPVGAVPVTDAVKVTLTPTIDGLIELTTLVVVAGLELTTCDSGKLLDTEFEPSPAYAATMLCVPTASAAVVHVALAPVSATAPQPAMVAPPSENATVPVGAVPATVAVKFTLTPAIAGLAELARPVVETTLFTTCDSAALLDAALPPSPEYAAAMLCVVALNVDVLQAAVRVLPAPVSATAPQVAMVIPPSVKLTVPVGALPVTDAVNVTLVPTIAGFAELETAVVEDPEFTTCESVALLDAALPPSPE